MSDLKVNFAGIKSPNPFWLASAPPTNSGAQIMRAFDEGWGGAVWKTLGQPITNVSSRFGATQYRGTRIVGFNNIELITDRPLEVNLKEITEVKKRYPNNAVIASIMVETREEWKDLIKRCVDAGADGLELNFGCPHGMCERGMGSAVGQEPRVCGDITAWAVEDSTVPVIVKLTPNVGNINLPARAAAASGARALSLINTIKSIIGVDLERGVLLPRVHELGTNGGYCGPAVKPIALFMVGQLGKAPEVNIPLSGIGGIDSWRDALEFIFLGASTVQVCTAVMHRGYRIVRDMLDGTERFMKDHGYETIDQMVGKALPSYTDWGHLDLNYEVVAEIDSELCIGCQLCVTACRDGAHDCISTVEGTRVPVVDVEQCIGCNLCHHVCPVPECLEMVEVDNGKEPMSWKAYEAALARGENPPHPGKSTHQTHF